MWTLTVKGEVIGINKTDIDKSGKNPKYILNGAMAVHDYKLDGATFEVGSKVLFQGKESDFDTKNLLPINVGDTLELTFTGDNVPSGKFSI